MVVESRSVGRSEPRVAAPATRTPIQFSAASLQKLAAKPLAAGPVSTLCARITIQPGMEGALKAAAKGALPVPGRGIHFARLVVIEEKAGETPHLMLGVIFDGSRDRAFDFLFVNGPSLESVFLLCVGYPIGTSADKAKLKTFIEAHEVHTNFLYPKYRTSAADIDHALRLRHRFLAFLRQWQLGEGVLPLLYQAFLNDFDDPPQPPVQAAPASPVFDPHRTRTLNMVHRITAGNVFLFRFQLMVAQYYADVEYDSLPDLNTLHFARISVIRGDTMLFASAYDGDFLQYVRDFGGRVGDEIDQLWRLTEGYPPNGCKNDVEGFIKWLCGGMYDAQELHIGHMPATVLEILASSDLREELITFRATHPASGLNLDSDLRVFVGTNQELLS